MVYDARNKYLKQKQLEIWHSVMSGKYIINLPCNIDTCELINIKIRV